MSGCGKRHNVLILDTELGMGGLEKNLFEFVSRIDRSHFSVKICCLKEGGYFRDAFTEMGIPFHEGILRHKYDALGYRRFLRVLEEERVDLIDTFAHPNTMLFSTLARMTGRVRGVVVSIHATGNREGGRLLHRWQRPLAGRVDRVVALAEMHREYLVTKEGIDHRRITVIPNGVDVGKYQPGPRRADLAADLGIREGDVVITTVASLKPVKGIDLLLRAAAEILPEVPGARFVVAGDGAERENLTRLAADLGISERVTFAGIRDDIDDILRLSDLFVLPSRTEAFPVAVLEAMASGLPIISTDVGSVREQIEDGANGVLVPPGDAGAIAAAIRGLLSQPEQMSEFGRRSRAIAEAKFRIDDMCTRREQLFSEILGCATGATPVS